MNLEKLKIRNFNYLKDLQSVVAIWEECDLIIPPNDPYEDIRKKMDFQPELFFVAVYEDEVVGTIMIGYEGLRGWINFLAVSPKWQRNGIGKELMRFAEKKLWNLGATKLNLQVRETNAGVAEFYNKIGYQKEHLISFGQRLK